MADTCVTTVTDEQFKQEVLDHAGVVIVDFYTPLCPPCRTLAPVLEDLCTDHSPHRPSLKIVKINAAENPQVALEHQIQVVPTLFLYHNGKRIAESRGHQEKPELEEWIDAAIDRVA